MTFIPPIPIFMMNKFLALAAAALLASSAHAQLVVDQAWVRTTVAHQATSAAYLTITSARGGKLVEASSSLASAVEVHEMKMDGDLMRMRSVAALALPAGKPVELKAGGFHMMLLGLKAPLKAGDVVPLKLVVEDALGKRETVDVRAVARPN
jgi:hypothetical protein